ncbi:velvet factor-domain-containing protein [Gymnopilus junonius]|uniref:Velvet factor-domain-containing protein n=1 Tax=Gymnopilus junonius TaxID=109634 RepID=A0A9P5TRX3_GYMJU|nr:velvet factor-domain-containing protein [Gymnopilus junonius]
MYSTYSLLTQPLSSSSQPQVTPPYRQQATYVHAAGESSSPPVLQPKRGAQLIGKPIYFSSGPFQGRTVRMELQEIQKANLGRKYARVDRRPLDPPPVVHLRMFEIHNPGSEAEVEKEMEYDDVQVLGLLCTVDLFPVPEPGSVTRTNHDLSPTASSAPPTQTAFYPSPSPSSPLIQSPGSAHGYRHYKLPFSSTASGSRIPSHFSGYALPSEETVDIVHHLENGAPITESSKQTQALVGATFVQPVVMDYQGSKSIIFVFADLAVKIEGHFILRYRAFDIFARPYSDSNDLAISAECYGGMFRVYSTKEFPGLSASTELTKRLSLWGVRLNIRVTERKRRKRTASDNKESSSPDDDD